MGKIPDALRAIGEAGIDVPTEADGEGDGTRMSKRARGGAHERCEGGRRCRRGGEPRWIQRRENAYANKTLNKTVGVDQEEKTRRPPPGRETRRSVAAGMDRVTDPGSGRGAFYNQSLRRLRGRGRRMPPRGGDEEMLLRRLGETVKSTALFAPFPHLGKASPGVSSLDVVENKFMTKQQRAGGCARVQGESRREEAPNGVPFKASESNRKLDRRANKARRVALTPPRKSPRDLRYKNRAIGSHGPSTSGDAPRGGWGRGREKSRGR